MKYCIHCGNELFDEAVVCPKCGCPSSDQSLRVSVENNSIATAGFVLSLCSTVVPILSILGLIFGIIGLCKSRRLNGNNRGFSIAAIIISSIIIAFIILILVLYISLLAYLFSGAGSRGYPYA